MRHVHFVYHFTGRSSAWTRPPYRVADQKLKPDRFGHEARVIGLVSVSKWRSGRTQYFHFAGSLALRRILGYGPKDPGRFLPEAI
jgi:hypothetical protein